jgi:large subunit ribosomal protein L9
MKVLLCEDVKDLGWLGDIVEVKTGYARNYLLPHGLAKIATDGNVRMLATEKAKHAEERIENRKRLAAAAAAVDGAEAVLAAKANEQGVLFGSVGPDQIAVNLREQGFEVADEVVRLAQHIKQTGTSAVTLKFAEDLTATVSVVVVPEGSDIDQIHTEAEERGDSAAEQSDETGVEDTGAQEQELQ